MPDLQTRKLGRTNLDITVLGFGGAPLGDLYEQIPEKRALSVIEAAYSVGVRLYDTAPLYGYGLSEHRFGQVLRRKPRSEFVLSTKVGRWLRPEAPERIDRGLFKGGLNFMPVVDYSYDGTMRALDQSYGRLGLDRIDIALIHDVDIWSHGSRDAYEVRFREAMEGAYRALDQLRAAGAIKAVGVGVNEVEPCVRFAQGGAFDCFLLAGRYTLLEQNGLDDLLPLAQRQQFSILLGGPFNSGILATGAKPGAKYNYSAAPPEIMARVARIEAVCSRHGVPLAAAAIQFPLGHDRIVSIVPGAVTAAEVEQNVRLINTPIPNDLWAELKHEGLLDPEAPVPPAVAA
jgi:D-threo-aldose 1-dehydrogenase